MALEPSCGGYFPLARRWNRVRLSIFLCFFLRIRFRRFLISEPMRLERVATLGVVMRTDGVDRWYSGRVGGTPCAFVMV